MASRTIATKRPGAAPSRARTGADRLEHRLVAAQRATLTATAFLSALAVWRPLPDPFMLPKITVVVLGAVLLAVLAGVRSMRSGRLSLPSGAIAWISGAFALALVLATLTADNPALAFVGNHSRYAGLMSYGAYLVVFLVAARLYASGAPRSLLVGLLAALGVLTAYGLVQVAGLDPYRWIARLDDPIFSTMGNTNFAGAYVALVLPVAAAAAVLPGWRPQWRFAAAVLAIPAAVYMLATGASQAVIAAAAGLAVVGAALVMTRLRSSAGRPARPSRWRWTAAAGVLAVLLAAAAGASRVAADVANSYAERLQFWQAALAIAADHPVLGTGLDSFRDYFPQYRPPAHAVARDYQITDSTHNAVLGMLSNGGLLLALTYLAFIGFTGWTLLRGLRATSADRLLPLAAFGGVWAAYQVQSLVSVDVPPLAFLHFLSAGVIIALVSPPGTRSWSLGLPPARPGRMLPRAGARRRPAAVALLLALLAVGSLAMWTGTRPLRADLAAGEGRGQKDGRGLPDLDRAVALAPWEAEYRIFQAQSRLDGGDRQGAFDAAVAAAELRHGSSKLAVGNADLATSLGDDAGALRWMELALERDPHNPQLLERAAAFFAQRGDQARATQLTERVQRLRAEHGGT